MLYVCIPVHNEAATIGVLLWRIRTVLQEYARDYEAVVYDDGSTDETPDVLEPYRKVLPLTVLRGERRLGTAAAVDALCRHVVAHTRYPRRDGAVFMQGDFTDRPEDLLELARRFEGGADLIVGRRPAGDGQPEGERRLRQWAPRVLRFLLRVPDVDDLVTSYRLVRVSVLRDAARGRGGVALSQGAGWTGVVDFALAVTPYARRVEMVELPGRYDLRPRASRLDWWSELRALASYAWRARGRRVVAGDRIGGDRPERPERPERADRAPESAADIAQDRPAIAERSARPERPGRAPRERRPVERPVDATGARGEERAPLARSPEGEPARVPRRGRPLDELASPARTPRAPRPERTPGADEERTAPIRRARRSERVAESTVPLPESAVEQEATRPAARPRRERSPERQAERSPLDLPLPAAPDLTAADAGDESPSPLDLADGSVLPETVEMATPEGESPPRKRARRRRRRGARTDGVAAGERELPSGSEADSDALPAASAAVRASREPVGAVGDVHEAAGAADVDPMDPFEGGSTGDGEQGEEGGTGGATRRRRRRRRSRGERAAGEQPGGAEGEAERAVGTDGRDGVALHQVELREPVERPLPPDRVTD